MQEEFEGFNKRQRENREVVNPTILSYLIEGILNELRTEETVASYATQQPLYRHMVSCTLARAAAPLAIVIFSIFLLAHVDNLEEVDQPLLGHLKAVHDFRALDVLDIALQEAR